MDESQLKGPRVEQKEVCRMKKKRTPDGKWQDCSVGFEGRWEVEEASLLFDFVVSVQHMTMRSGFAVCFLVLVVVKVDTRRSQHSLLTLLVV